MVGDEACVDHAERLATLEAQYKGLTGSVGGLAATVDGLSTEIRTITKSVDKLKWALYALVLLQFSETKSIESVIHGLLKLFIGG